MDGDGGMGADEVGPAPEDGGADAGSIDRITFVNLDSPHPDMERRMRETGFCHLLVDARESGGEISLIGRDIFRKEVLRPFVDELHMTDGHIPVELLREELDG